MKEKTVLDQLNEISSDPLKRIRFIQTIAAQLSSLRMWPVEFIQDVLNGEKALEDKLSNFPGCNEGAKKILGEDTYVAGEKERNKCTTLARLFLERIKPELDKIMLEAGYPVVSIYDFNVSTDQFINKDKEEGWSINVER